MHWLKRLAEAYLNDHKIAVVLHGETLSPVRHNGPEGPSEWLPLPELLTTRLFRQRDLALRYDRAQGIRASNAGQTELWNQHLRQLNVSAEAQLRASQSAGRAFLLLDSALQTWLKAGKSAALVVEFAETLLPAGDLGGEEERAIRNLVLGWLGNRLFLEADFTLVLVVGRKDDLQARLLAHPATIALEIPRPDEEERNAWLQRRMGEQPEQAPALQAILPLLVSQSSGCNLHQVDQLTDWALAQPQPLTEGALKAWRRDLLHTEPAPEPLVNDSLKPEWVRQLERVYATRTIAQFILHGNIFDKFRSAEGAAVQYRSLPDYLLHTVFGRHDIVLGYDRAGGLTFRDDAVKRDLSEWLSGYDARNGTSLLTAFPKDPVAAFEVLDRYFRERLAQQKKVAFLVEYAEVLVPASPAANSSVGDRAVLVQLLKWARDATFVRSEMAIVLLTEKLNDLNPQLAQTPYSAEIDLPFPDEEQRLAYLRDVVADNAILPDYLEMSVEVLARLTAGLNILQLNLLLAYVFRNRTTLTYELLNLRKKELIEREAGGLLEFVPTTFTLDDVAGHAAVKAHLRAASNAIRKGHLDVLPMGYLLNGPVGTGKTFIVTCFSGDIGIPMVVLKNFRSRWQGQTESNLEKVLGLLKAMSPVAVMIDEADAALGNRNSSGDSGVSSRVFSMIATFMSNTQHRGRILWFLLTARPDLMPIDLKRQGRAEEHLALFYPESLAEKQEMLTVMLRKTRLRHLKAEDFAETFFHNLPIRSGADMEAALTRAKFLASQQGAEAVTVAHVEQAFADFIPPAYPEEVELQTLLAVSECTSRELLPDRFRNLERGALLQRIDELKLRVK